MRYNIFGMYLLYCTFAVLLMIIFISIQDIKKNQKSHPGIDKVPEMRYFPADIQSKDVYEDYGENVLKKEDLKYILQWKTEKSLIFPNIDQGRDAFIKKSCKYTNCYLTSDPNYLSDITKFDLIVFSGPDITNSQPLLLPQRRSPHQRYAFGSNHSPQYYPVCDKMYDGYFNWTWTYRLDSDIRWGYVVVRDHKGDVIGPRKDMQWMKVEDMEPISNQLLSILRKKTKAAVWFVSNCATASEREKFAMKLQAELIKTYDLKIDIFGDCGELSCSKQRKYDYCSRIIESKYYFYLAFENAFSDDYVTEQVLHGLQFNAVPIVYGGANYSRFLPEGSYLDAIKLGVKGLAATMNQLIHDIDVYSKYFKWQNHYSFHKTTDTEDTDDYCNLCSILNNDKKIQQKFVYNDFRKWWNTPRYSPGCN